MRDLGYRVEAPYSGTEYDLVRGIMTAYSEKRRVNTKNAAKSHSRKVSIHAKLVAAAEALLALAKRSESRPNKENAALTAQIRALVEKWDK